jgi:GntR family transcriptional regulator/MocR family aminotransferase
MPKKRAFSAAALLVRLDPEDHLPLHRQLYQEIRSAILSGALAPGEQIPASRSLAADLGVSRTTVLQAVEQLKAEGYLASVVGSGTRVASTIPEKLSRVAAVPAPPAREGAPCTLSVRGATLARLPRIAPRASKEPRAFRLGIPGLDLFPRKLWTRLTIQRARLTSVTELDYGYPAGIQPLREEIARYVASARGVRCTPEQVIVVSGAPQGIGFAAKMLLDPGDRAWIEEPGYLSARAGLATASARVVPVPVDDEGIDVAEGIRRAPDARMVYVSPSHQFPLGVTMSLRRRLALLEWARSANAWIVEDDYDNEFRYGGPPLMALHGLDGGARVIYVGTFSKSLFPALRIGFMVVPRELVEGFTRARVHGDQHPPTLQQLVLTDFLREGHFGRHVRRMRKAYEQRQNFLLDELRRELGCVLTVEAANAGLHFVAHLPPGLDDQEVMRQALARGVEVSALSMHCMEPTRLNGLLLGFASANEEGLRKGVRLLGDAIHAVSAAGRHVHPVDAAA